MRGLSALIVWLGVALFSAAGLLLLFYTAALLLPVLLVLFAVSMAAGWYRRVKIKRAFENLKPFFGHGDPTAGNSRRNSKIIDAEFEIIEENDRKS